MAATAPQGYAVMGQEPLVAGHPVASAGFGGSAVWVLVWVVIIIIIIAILAALFMGSGDLWGGSSSSDDRERKNNNWNFGALGGLVVFIIVILFLAWLISSAGCYGRV